MIELLLCILISHFNIGYKGEIKGKWNCVNNSVKSEIEPSFNEEKYCSTQLKFLEDTVYVSSTVEMSRNTKKFSYRLENNLLLIGNSTYALKKLTNDSLVIKDTVLDLPPIGPFFHEKIFIRDINID